MATRVLKELICDMCYKTDGVVRWRLGKANDGGVRSVDLCGECGAPFEEAYAKIPRGKRGQSQARPVYTEAQVKAKRRKKSPKTA